MRAASEASEVRSIGRMIVGGLVIAAACAALFLVPSAFLIHKGQSRWLALAAGLAAFPVVPVLWHLLAERRRKRAGGKSTLTGSDRFVMRLVAVALVAIAPLLVFARGQTWTAVKEHPTWYLHWGGSSGSADAAGWDIVEGEAIAGDPRLINYLPDDAEVVIWMRATRQFLESMQKQFGGEVKKDPAPDMAEEVLMATKKDGFLALVCARKGLDDMKAEDRAKLEKELADKLFGGRTVPVKVYSALPDLHVVVTENWDEAVRARAAGTRPAPAELLAVLQTTPADAPLVAAARNAAIGGVIVDRGTGHLRITDKGLRFEADLQLASATAAGALRGTIGGYFDGARDDAPAGCKEPVGKLIDGIDVGGDGVAVRVAGKLGFEDLMGSMFCRMGSGDGGEED